ARLAARLTGMHIDIKNESLAREVMREMPKEVELPAEEGEHRCEYTGPTGIQCRNMARPGSRYCGIHEQLAKYADTDVSDDPDSLI
ncbi:MAG: CCCH zinc finger protein, partial [Parafannyhessea sp.]|uniref:CCCH zinc finger protein n=1 Tax=Parafannyhessea sp. TaxID=2847324 RepID=UPI003F0B0EA4